jgi:hypothetical protein
MRILHCIATRLTSRHHALWACVFFSIAQCAFSHRYVQVADVALRASSNGVYDLFLNGVKVDSVTLPSYTNTLLSLGVAPNPSLSNFEGFVSDLQTYAAPIADLTILDLLLVPVVAALRLVLIFRQVRGLVPAAPRDAASAAESAAQASQLSKERELHETQLSKERELRETQLSKERGLREIEVSKERELREKDSAYNARGGWWTR